MTLPTGVGRRALLAGTGAVLVERTVRAATPPVATRDATVLEARLLGGTPAFNAAVPGPTLRIGLGESVVLRIDNNLAVPTGLVFDGVRSSAAATPTIVPPGGRAALRFVPPDAGTYQYHAAGPEAAAQTDGGLRGVLIVDERAPPPVDTDLVLALGGADRPLVNSETGPMKDVVAPGGRVRLRLVNGWATRIATVVVAGARASVIAVDGQPSALFQLPGGAVPIGPGALFDLLFDMPGSGAVTAVLRGENGQADLPLLALATAGKPAASHPPIAALPANPRLPERIALEKAARHSVTIGAAAEGRWTLNGSVAPHARPLFVARRGVPVVLALENRTTLVQPMEVAGQCWRILHDLDDGWDPYWRNTILLAPGKTKHVAFVPDETGRWSLDAGDLARRAAGLAGFFEVR